jgi:hypothetical protein
MFYENEDTVRKSLLSIRQVVRYTEYMGKNIKFVSLHENILEMFYPKPASECIPDWYKDQFSYTYNKKYINQEGKANPTIKKCMPLFDSLTSGYIIFTCMDMEVSNRDGVTYYSWADSFTENIKPITFHDNKQADKYPFFKNSLNQPKFTNPWAILTPKGYSTLFVSPMHRDLPFEVLPGIVDTDTYHSAVSLPFFLKDPDWTGTIPAGTPIVQVIPFKRDNWEMSMGDEKDRKKITKTNYAITSFFLNAYKNLFWNKKNFK